MAASRSRACTAAYFAVAGETSRPLQLGYEAVLNGRAVVHRLACELPAISADLIEVAATVYAVDRLVPRPATRDMSAGLSWARELRLGIPVREPQLWSAHARQLTELLAWLTDDTWSLEFFQFAGGTGLLDEPQAFLFHTIPQGAAPALFSGGLDSAAGLAAHLVHGDAAAVSVDTNNWMQHVQQRVARQLSTASQHTCVPLRYRVSLHGRSAESSQRSRGLLFLAAGIATAWALRQDRLRVFENGIGAINLPYLRSRFGSQATRAMHPRTLLLAQDLAAAISHRPFRIDAPTLTATKAHLIRSVPAAADPALALTVSCDTGFSARVLRHAPCGVCTSCLLRRQALHAAGKAVLDAEAGYGTSSPEGSFTLQAMLWQVTRLRTCLTRPDPWQALVSEFPEILDTAPLAPTEVINLYRSYVQEWDGLQGTLGIGRTAA